MARGFFRMAGLAGAMLELGAHICQCNAPLMQDDKQMIKQIGTFAGEGVRVAFDRGDHDLDRLLAEFLGGAGWARVEKRFGIGCRGARLSARGNNRGEIIEGEAVS